MDRETDGHGEAGEAGADERTSADEVEAAGSDEPEPRVIDSSQIRDRPGAHPGSGGPSRTMDKAAEDPPEGHAPKHDPNPRQISLLLVLVVVGLLALGLVLAIAVGPTIGVGVGVLALLLLLFNPEFWAAMLRAKDRVDAGDRRR